MRRIYWWLFCIGGDAYWKHGWKWGEPLYRWADVKLDPDGQQKWEGT